MNVKIPKIIHYCWFGGNPLPQLAVKCIESWKKFFPDYTIKCWNEENFDVKCIPYVKEAYEEKKYAFVSDFARFKILYEEGGLYFDTDVQIIKPLNDIIERGAFMGCENKPQYDKSPILLGVNPGLGLGVNPGHRLYKELIDLYKTLSFRNPDGSLNLKTVVDYTSELLARKGLRQSDEIQNVSGVWIYPHDYFCPMRPTLVLNITENSRTIHLFNASWCSKSERLRKKFKRLLGYKFVKRIQPIILFVRSIFKR